MKHVALNALFVPPVKPDATGEVSVPKSRFSVLVRTSRSSSRSTVKIDRRRTEIDLDDLVRNDFKNDSQPMKDSVSMTTLWNE